MQITRIKTRGFRKFEEEFETDLYNTTLITGGNAKGKTNILYAIVWGFLGTNLTGDDKVFLGNKNADSCYVELHFIDNLGVKHILKRQKNRYNNFNNFLLLDEKQIEQKELISFYKDKKLLLSILNSNYFISRSPSEQKSLLDKYLPNIDIRKIYEKLDNEEKNILEGCPTDVTKYINELNSNKLMYEDKIKNYQGKIAYAENIINQKLEEAKDFNKQEELDLLLQEVSFLKSDKKIENREKQIKVIEDINKQIENYKIQIENISKKMIQGKNIYMSLKNDTISCCPTCKQKLNNIGRISTIQKMKSDLENDYSTKIKLESELQELKKRQAIEKCNLYALGNENSEEQNEKIKQVDMQIKALEKEKLEVEQFNTSIRIKKNNIQEAKEDIKQFQESIANLYKSIDSIKKAKDIAQKLLINYIEAKMQFATKHLKNVSIKYYSILKDSGEIKQDFIITYKSNEFKNLSRSETIATSLEISNMLNKISGINFMLFVDDSESCADYDFIEEFAGNTQIVVSRVEKSMDLKISNYEGTKAMQLVA